MLGSGARPMTCGNSHYNLAVHPPALLPTRCVNIISRHCAAVIGLLRFALASYATAACYHGIWLAGPVLIWV